MAFPIPSLTFVRCADVTPSGTAVENMLDAIYTALTAANDYRGTAKPSTHTWTITRRQVASVTNALTCEPPASAGLGVTPVVIIGGRTLAGTPTAPTMLAPDTAFNSTLVVGVNKNGGAYNSWDAALPMTSGQWSGYYRASNTIMATSTIVRCYVSQETILVCTINTTTSHAWFYSGAILQPYSNDTTVCAESDGRLYGMTTSGGSAIVSSTWLTTAAAVFSHNTAANTVHSAVFQPGTGTMWACGTRTIYSTGGGTIPETQDNLGAYIGDVMDFGRNIATGANTGTRLGTLRGIYRAGNVISGRWLRSGATDLYHYVSVDTANVANAFMLPAVA
jgi:hypothetical protein